MVSARVGFPALCLDLFPTHLVDGDADIERPHVVEGLHAVAAAKDPYLVAVEHGGVGAPGCGDVRLELGVRPAAGDGVEHVYAVVVGWALAAAEYDDLAVDEGGGVGTAGWWDVAVGVWVGPLHSF